MGGTVSEEVGRRGGTTCNGGGAAAPALHAGGNVTGPFGLVEMPSVGPHEATDAERGRVVPLPVPAPATVAACGGSSRSDGKRRGERLAEDAGEVVRLSRGMRSPGTTSRGPNDADEAVRTDPALAVELVRVSGSGAPTALVPTSAGTRGGGPALVPALCGVMPIPACWGRSGGAGSVSGGRVGSMSGDGSAPSGDADAEGGEPARRSGGACGVAIATGDGPQGPAC